LSLKVIGLFCFALLSGLLFTVGWAQKWLPEQTRIAATGCVGVQGTGPTVVTFTYAREIENAHAALHVGCVQ